MPYDRHVHSLGCIGLALRAEIRSAMLFGHDAPSPHTPSTLLVTRPKPGNQGPDELVRLSCTPYHASNGTGSLLSKAGLPVPMRQDASGAHHDVRARPCQAGKSLLDMLCEGVPPLSPQRDLLIESLNFQPCSSIPRAVQDQLRAGEQ